MIDQGDAYYCFCSEEELERKKAAAEASNLAPHYDGSCRALSKEQAASRVAKGERAAIRFKAIDKSYTFHDLVRGEVTFPEGMVGDFIILRSDGLPVYNYCCVVDDWQMKITHVLRAEEHLPNTLRQLMLYEKFGVNPPPLFGHLSLIVGDDRQKLSKRRGDTSVDYYRNNGYLPEAMVNYLVLLGWSHPQEQDIFTMEELISVFSIDRFSKSPAVLDLAKLRWVNGQHLHCLTTEKLLAGMTPFVPSDHPFHLQSEEWKRGVVEFFKPHLEMYQDILPRLQTTFQVFWRSNHGLKEILNFPTTPAIVGFLKGEVEKHSLPFLSVVDFDRLVETAKKTLGVKGRPLFLGVRAALTGRAEGPDLKHLIPLTPLSVILSRLQALQEHFQ